MKITLAALQHAEFSECRVQQPHPSAEKSSELVLVELVRVELLDVRDFFGVCLDLGERGLLRRSVLSCEYLFLDLG